MAILSALKVTEVSDLRAEANNFQVHADELRNITDHMLALIENMQNVWHGDARTKYANQFEGLRDDMAKIYDMCSEYSTDLLLIADNYQTAEEENAATAGALKADVELKL